jgi:hypothetical protein
MNNQKANQFETALQRAEQGQEVDEHLAPLVETAQLLSGLGDPVPAPPHRLAPGRQRLLAEAARLRGAPAQGKKGWVLMPRVWKLASVLAAALLLFGMVFGAGHAAAASLPGQPFYGLKLAGEWVLVTLTVDPEAELDLNLLLVNERLDEVEALLVRGQAPDEATIAQVREQIQAVKGSEDATWEDLPEWAQQQLYNMIQIQKRDVLDKLEALEDGESIATVRNLVRKMVRDSWDEEENPGQGAQQRHGAPADADDPKLPSAEDLPDPSEQPGYGPFPIEQPGAGVTGEKPEAGPPDEPPGNPAVGDTAPGEPPDTVPGIGPGPVTEEEPAPAGYGPGAPPADEDPVGEPPAPQAPAPEPPVQDPAPGPGPGAPGQQSPPDSSGSSGSSGSKGN